MRKLVVSFTLLLVMLTVSTTCSAVKTPGCNEITSMPPVYMSVWGYVGGTTFNFDMNGTKGSYIPFNMAEGKEYGARQQLKLVSYNRKSGVCIINAYLKGAYIGQFKGVFEETNPTGENVVQTYNGTFTSSKGAKLKFSFHFD